MILEKYFIGNKCSNSLMGMNIYNRICKNGDSKFLAVAKHKEEEIKGIIEMKILSGEVIKSVLLRLSNKEESFMTLFLMR
ncbi:hypothetical protein EFE32_08040 [Lactococcus lactis subsp. lactis]|uniref:hypothetical protein n=1 Tax=Lactococcus lactis TaxID=1358 RepID=UPI00223BB46A|nr:hypothetical protein [Lactococcus lactis]MCT0016791.1 hypothetical protein [Lactococcus lactis subsp. lactis]